MVDHDLREQVRLRYAKAATSVTDPHLETPKSAGADSVCCQPQPPTPCCDQSKPPTSCCDQPEAEVGHFGPELYSKDQQGEVPDDAIGASLGCGNPLLVAELRPGEVVLDLGSGGGIDVLLSARRVGPTGFVVGVDMTDEMLELAERNKAEADVANVVFLKGNIEAIPLPGESVDVVISNCVINLSVDKPAVLAEMFRVLRPGGRIGVADVVAEDHVTPPERAERGSFVGCIAGALSRAEYLNGLTEAGFEQVSVEFTSEVVPNMHAAIIRAVKPSE